MESELYLKINHYKHKFDRIHTFYHKRSLESLVFVLEDYLNLPDISFQKHVKDKKFYSRMKEIKNLKLHSDFKNFINSNYKLVNNMLAPYAVENSNIPHFKESYIDFNSCLKIVADFLMQVNPILYNMFCELYNNHHILFKENVCGLELSEKRKNSIYIIVGNLQSVSDMANLVHELGHAYKDYIFQKCHKYYDYNDLLQSEISSEVLELMFLDYLIKKNIYYNDAYQDFVLYHSQMINDSKRLIRLDKNINNQSYINSLSYFIGRVIACNFMINKNMTYDELIKFAYKRDLYRVLKDLNIDHDKVVSKIKEFHY